MYLERRTQTHLLLSPKPISELAVTTCQDSSVCEAASRFVRCARQYRRTSIIVSRGSGHARFDKYDSLIGIRNLYIIYKHHSLISSSNPSHIEGGHCPHVLRLRLVSRGSAVISDQQYSSYQRDKAVMPTFGWQLAESIPVTPCPPKPIFRKGECIPSRFKRIVMLSSDPILVFDSRGSATPVCRQRRQ